VLTQHNGHYAVQGLWRLGLLISVPLESSYATSH